MSYGHTIDIEDAVRSAIASPSLGASAPPVPPDLGEVLPWVHVTRTGGSEAGPVLDAHLLDLDVYHAAEASAMETAGALCGAVRDLAGRELGGVPCYRASVTTLPYNNPDPRHPTLARCTLKIQVLTRTGA